MSLLFYRERIYYTDTAFYLFNIVNKEAFFVAHGRYIDILLEILPVTLTKLHFPLEWIAMSFSLNIALFYVFIFGILKKIIPSESAIWGLVFLLCFPVTDTFYFLAAEVIIGLAYLVLFYVLTQKYLQNDKIALLIINIFFVVFSIWIHPIIPLCILGVIGLAIVEQGFRVKTAIILPIFTAFLMIFLRQKGIIGDWYDAQSSEQLSSFLQKLQTEGFIYTSFLPFFAKNYLWKSLFFVWETLVFVYLFKEKKYLMFAYWFGISVFFLFLAYLRNTEELNYAYTEAYLLLVSFWAMLILGKAFETYFLQKGIKYLAIFLILFSLGRIAFTPFYSEKIEALDNLFAQVRKGEIGSKLIVRDKNRFFPIPLQGMDWALPYESLLQSAETGTPISVVLIDANSALSDSIYAQKDLFQAAVWMKPIPQQALNVFYFGKLPKEEYRFLP